MHAQRIKVTNDHAGRGRRLRYGHGKGHVRTLGSERRLLEARLGRRLVEPAPALAALEAGRPLPRPLTQLERVALAIAAHRPEHQLAIGTAGSTRQEVSSLWTLFRRRVERHKANRNVPLIYLASVAQGTGNGGVHLHAVLWERPFYFSYQKHARDLGLGQLHLTPISEAPHSVLTAVSYVLGQTESVFGSDHHEHHRSRPINARRFNLSHRQTLSVHHPGLLVALDRAKSRSVSDTELFEGLPRFINTDISKPKGKNE